MPGTVELRGARRGRSPGELHRLLRHEPAKAKAEPPDAPKGPDWPISHDGLDAERRRATLLGLRTSSPFLEASLSLPRLAPRQCSSVTHWQATGQEPPGLAAAGSRVTGLTGRL